MNIYIYWESGVGKIVILWGKWSFIDHLLITKNSPERFSSEYFEHNKSNPDGNYYCEGGPNPNL